MLSCLSCCPLSDPPLSCLSCMHRSIVGVAVLFFFVHVSLSHLFPGMSTSNILLTMCSSFILFTWPYHFSRFSVIYVDACTTVVVPLMFSFRIVSLLVTPHIHLSILISFTSSRASCPLVVALLSACSLRPSVILLSEFSRLLQPRRRVESSGRRVHKSPGHLSHCLWNGHRMLTVGSQDRLS